MLIHYAYLEKANNTWDVSPLPRDLGKNNKSKAKNVDLLDNIWWTLRFDQRLQLSLACRILKIIFQNFNFISWWMRGWMSICKYDKLVVVTGLVTENYQLFTFWWDIHELCIRFSLHWWDYCLSMIIPVLRMEIFIMVQV